MSSALYQSDSVTAFDWNADGMPLLSQHGALRRGQCPQHLAHGEAGGDLLLVAGLGHLGRPRGRDLPRPAPPSVLDEQPKRGRAGVRLRLCRADAVPGPVGAK
ncbi:hypothetical protein [Streptomyces sp. NPDC002853]